MNGDLVEQLQEAMNEIEEERAGLVRAREDAQAGFAEYKGYVARELLVLEASLYSQSVAVFRLAASVRELSRRVFGGGVSGARMKPGVELSLPPQVTEAIESLLVAITDSCVGQPVHAELKGGLVTTEGSSTEHQDLDQSLGATVSDYQVDAAIAAEQP